MQLKNRLSIITSLLLSSTSLVAEDYISVQYMNYNEDNDRVEISAPSFEINKDFGADYTLNLSYVQDALSGATPTYYDITSGASAKLPEGVLYQNDIFYGDIPYKDKRDAYALSLTKRFENRDELTLGLSYSDEKDYESKGFSSEYLHYLDSSKNQSISLGFSYQKDNIDIYCFLGNSECDGISGASSKVVDKDLEVFSGEVGFTQIIDKSSLAKFSLFYIAEDGYLTNPYMRVDRNYNTTPQITQEQKPNSKNAMGLFLQYSKALNSKTYFNSSYRIYSDSWNIDSHTLNSELFYRYSDKTTLGLGLRFYTQSDAKFYSGKRDYFTNEQYASRDRRLSNIDSLNYKFSLEYDLNSDTTLNSSINYYEQIDILDALYYNFGIKYKF